ncbi:hypothetical protein [uncultured Chryseobacterium sp.]|uniref:hypothetical protein n=1 Tax=uncultured Chryseobacterium sp. TaxID=259322 RepID=UPI0025FAF1DC|nr:hypothetical protein [uncultured Chryseobacterium sp.]
MSKDKFQDKYDEALRQIREEKMDWDFEDFLKKAESDADEAQADETPVIPLRTQTKPAFPKWFWMAAGLAMILGLGFIFSISQKSGVEDQARLVENRIRQQKSSFVKENNEIQEQVAFNHPSDSLEVAKKDSVFQENTMAEKDYLEEILPKRGRMKKDRKPKYVSRTPKDKAVKDPSGYNDSYVIVNGKKIENVEEAINVTKYSFQILANNVNEKLAQPKVVDDNY